MNYPRHHRRIDQAQAEAALKQLNILFEGLKNEIAGMQPGEIGKTENSQIIVTTFKTQSQSLQQSGAASPDFVCRLLQVTGLAIVAMSAIFLTWGIP